MNRIGPIRNANDNSFVNNFWGSSDAGFRVVQTRIKDSLSTLQELLDYYQERIAIEKEFTKKLEKLNSKIPLGSHETGSLKVSLDKLAQENSQMSKNNHKFIKSVAKINYDNLHDFYTIYHKKVTKIDHHMNKILAKRADAAKQVESTKAKFQEDCISIKSLRLCCQTTWGKELEKNEAKLSKVTQSINQSKKAYQIALAHYKELNDIYVQDWAIALSDFYKLEIERIQLCKVNCFNFCNNVATLCVENDQSVDLARSVFAKIQPPKDLQDFGLAHGTGDKIFKEPQFVDFMNGYDEEGSPTEFSVAQYDTPDYQPILSRTYSVYSHVSQQTHNSSNHATHTSPTKELPPVNLPPPTKQVSQSPPKTPSPSRKPPPTVTSVPHLNSSYPPIKPTTASVYSSSPEDKNDVFSLHKNEDELARSNGSSNYSNPTNYSSSSSDRHWASPRRKEKQLNQFQEQINLKSKELPSINSHIPNLQASGNGNATNKHVPIMKDFSIDFMAKALEDLNSGGNGDISQYRRSVRRARAEEAHSGAQTVPNTPFKSASDYVDDRTEVATRYESINFSRPAAQEYKRRPQSMLEPFNTAANPTTPRPKSMLEPYEPYLDQNDSASTCIVKSDRPKRTLSKSPTKSYTNLRAIVTESVEQTDPKRYVGKAKARYSYKPQHHGELYFKKGWNMYIIHRQEDNWYLCELGENCMDRAGMVGLVPGNYLVEGNDVF